MNDAVIIKKQHGPGLLEREAQALMSCEFKNPSLPAFDVFSGDQNHSNKVNTISVSPLWRWPANAINGVDAKLVSLGVPPSICTVPIEG
jgi:hypothetical protein